MRFWWRLMRGGVFQDHRTEMLGLATGLAGLIRALADWTVGDLSLLGLAKAVAENWPLIAGGFGLALLSAKIERRRQDLRDPEQSVSAIADKALRR